MLAYGPHILGPQSRAVVEAVRRQLGRGTAYGHTCEQEVELAERICAALPSVEMVRFVDSGTEATMSAIRLARGVTGRDLVVKFAGAYHGHADALLAAAGSGVATLALPGSAGVPRGAVSDTLVLPYNARGGGRRGLQRPLGPHRRGDRRAGGRQHGLRSPCPASWMSCAGSPASMAPC